MSTRLFAGFRPGLVLALSAAPLCAAPPDSAQKIPGGERLAAIGAEVAKLGDWQEHFDLVEPAIDRWWEENGWTDESDVFARETLREVAAIPPWEFTRRIERLTDAVRRRYHFSDEQTAEFQSRTYQMVGSMILRHGGTIFQHTREAVGTRLRGEPYTPQQVSRWTRESETLLRQARMQFERMAEEMSRSFTPAQKKILRRDMKSYHHRATAMNKLRARWLKGQWRPADWGLQDDPIYQQARETQRNLEMLRERMGAGEGSRRPTRPQPPAHVPHDETTWERYVRLFIERYQLDEGQARTALSILREVQGRAADYRRLHREELDRVPLAEKESAKTYQPIIELFEELKRRVHRIPTDAQRRQAQGAEQAGT